MRYLGTILLLTTTSTENTVYRTTNLYYKQNHTMLPVYKGVNVCMFTKKVTYVATVFNTTKNLGDDTCVNKSINYIASSGKTSNVFRDTTR